MKKLTVILLMAIIFLPSVVFASISYSGYNSDGNYSWGNIDGY